MNRQDARKRAFSQAFQRKNQLKFGDSLSQPAKRFLSYPCGSTDFYQQEFDQENRLPFDQDCTAASDSTPRTQIRRPKLSDSQYAQPAHHTDAPLQDELCSIRPGRESKAGDDVLPPPVLRKRQHESPLLCISDLTPTVVRGQSMFGPSPYVRPDFSSSTSTIAGAYSCSEDSPMSDAVTAVALLTPSALGFGGLSLNNHDYSSPSSPLRDGEEGNRATVRIVSTASLKR